MGEASKQQEIQILYRPKKPVPLSELRVAGDDHNFAAYCQPSDGKVIDMLWRQLQYERGSAVYSVPMGLGLLHAAQGARLVYRATEFKVWYAVHRTCADPSPVLNTVLYEKMRVAAVGAAVRTVDGSTFVHRRSQNVTHIKGKVDSSVAGFAFLNGSGVPDFGHALAEKLHRELKITDNEIIDAYVTGAHSARAPDFSGMVDFVVNTNVERADLERRVDPRYFSQTFFLMPEEIPAFILHHYARVGDMTSEGCATLLNSLNEKQFAMLVRDLHERGKEIRFGSIADGVFHPREIDL